MAVKLSEELFAGDHLASIGLSDTGFERCKFLGRQGGALFGSPHENVHNGPSAMIGSSRTTLPAITVPVAMRMGGILRSLVPAPGWRSISVDPCASFKKPVANRTNEHHRRRVRRGGSRWSW